MVLLDHLVHLAIQENLVHQVSLEVLVLKEIKALKDRKDHKVFKDLEARLENLEYLEKLVLKGLLVKTDSWGKKEHLDLRETMVHLVSLEPEALQGFLEAQGYLELREKSVLLAVEDSKVTRE